VRPWSLHALLRNYYVPLITQPVAKAVIIISCLCLFISGAYQIRRSTIGLELSDVLPDNTPPSAFLKARDEYFSFYPMFMVLRGEGLDFAQRQTEIEHLRNEIG
jgi:patched 1 protein